MELERHYLGKLLKEIHADRINRADRQLLNTALAVFEDTITGTIRIASSRGSRGTDGTFSDVHGIRSGEWLVASGEQRIEEKADPSPPFATVFMPAGGATGFGMTSSDPLKTKSRQEAGATKWRKGAEASFGGEKAASSRRTPKVTR